MAASDPEVQAPEQRNEKGIARPLQVAERGSLVDTPLPSLLLEIYRARFSGAIELTRGKTKKRILLQNGAPISSESNLSSETLGLQLIDQGIITPEDHERVSSYMQRKGCKEGVALLALELLDPKSLFMALKEQVRRRLLEAFAWAEGEYVLQRSGCLEQEVQVFRSDPYLLVREGLLGHWGADRMLADLAPRMEQFPVPSAGFKEGMRRLGNDETRTIFSAIDGRANLGAAIGTGFSSPAVLATIWILAHGGLIHFADEPVTSDADDSALSFDAEIEIEVLGAGDADAAQWVGNGTSRSQGAKTGAATHDRAARAGDGTAASSDAAEALRAEVLERIDQLDELDHYQLLDIPTDASSGAIRKAYFTLAKRYHPDALSNLGLGDIREQAATVFARIAEANDTLKDPAKRREYDAAMNDDEPEIDANALAQAETFYRKGEILVKMGDFRGALKFFAPAVELWPDESAYQGALGWALYKQPRPDAAAAAFHLEKAVELDDSDPVPMFRLGVVLRAVGDANRSAELMARAKILDPKIS